MRCTCFGAQAPAKVGVHHKKMMHYGTASSGGFLFYKEKCLHFLRCHLVATPPRARRGNFPARRNGKKSNCRLERWRNRCCLEGMFIGKDPNRERESAMDGLSFFRGNLHSRQGKARAPQCLPPPGESARSPGNSCCRHSRGPHGRVGAFPAGTGRPRGSAEGCPAGSRPEGAP